MFFLFNDACKKLKKYILKFLILVMVEGKLILKSILTVYKPNDDLDGQNTDFIWLVLFLVNF